MPFISQVGGWQGFHSVWSRTGFGRTAANSGVNDVVAGTITLTLTQPADAGVEAGNSVSIDVTYQGSEGGTWLREDSTIVRLSQPRS